MQRDPKGLYAKAKAGQLRNFTGIDAPYEAPDHPEIHLRTHETSADELAAAIMDDHDRREALFLIGQRSLLQPAVERGLAAGKGGRNSAAARVH